ncbi:MAG: methyltransferase family protein [Myxococcota bacterium]
MRLFLFGAVHGLFYAPAIARLARVSAREGPPFAREARWAMWLHGAALVFAYVALLLAGSDAIEDARPLRVGVGAGVLLAGVVLNALSVRALRSWRLAPTIGADHELCTSGPYRWVRHPVYAAFDLLVLGSAIWVGTAPLWAAVALAALAGDARARLEERALVAAFGDRYRAYARRVARFVPRTY